MSEYLSKEEIKQWRSSLEKITLEEFAKRLGKTLKEEKQTRDIVDIVLKNEKISATVSEISGEKPKEKILKIASKAVDMQEKALNKEEKKDLFSGLNITFKKSLTQREQAVLEHFIKNKNQIVYAKDLASVLELPTDYVYKYIKNLRTKINEDILQNAVKGGYRLNIQ
ncbi:TPA: helix-turn-helix domain-containing protein [Candidatus Galligastranaerophilus faecipullorum]|nr:helix-turn-helix domain-containing protein [Candidatus Galligastranaerophilus faecipullorum]